MKTRNEGTVAEIAAEDGRSVQRIHQFALEAGFPTPLYTVGKSKVYDLRAGRRFLAKRGDKRRTA